MKSESFRELFYTFTEPEIGQSLDIKLRHKTPEFFYGGESSSKGCISKYST